MPPSRKSRPSIPESEYPPPSAPGARDEAARARAREAERRADEALDVASRATEDLHEMRRLFGSPPSPGVQGSGVVGAVVQIQARQEAMDAKLDRLLAAREPSEPPRRRPPRPAAVIALVAALGGAGGIVAIISAARGSAPPTHTPAGGAP